MKTRTPALVVTLTLATSVLAQPPQTVQDEYAEYDLLAPDTSSFRAVYEVSVTTPGATTFSDGIGSGLTTSNKPDDAVVDVMSGAPLKFEVTARAIEVKLARPVPADGGQARLRTRRPTPTQRTIVATATGSSSTGQFRSVMRPSCCRRGISSPTATCRHRCSLIRPAGSASASCTRRRASPRSCSKRKRARRRAMPRSRGP